jgi:hypothetical protein
VAAIKAAAKVPTVKRFVLTSSSRASYWPHPNVKQTITTESVDDEVVGMIPSIGAKDVKDITGLEMYAIYSAGKTTAEKEVWKWYNENKPAFVLNTGTLPKVDCPGELTSGKSSARLQYR